MKRGTNFHISALETKTPANKWNNMSYSTFKKKQSIFIEDTFAKGLLFSSRIQNCNFVLDTIAAETKFHFILRLFDEML